MLSIMQDFDFENCQNTKLKHDYTYIYLCMNLAFSSTRTRRFSPSPEL